MGQAAVDQGDRRRNLGRVTLGEFLGNETYKTRHMLGVLSKRGAKRPAVLPLIGVQQVFFGIRSKKLYVSEGKEL